MGIISIVYDLDSDTYMAVKKTNTLNQNYYEFLQQEVSAWLILNKHLNIVIFFIIEKIQKVFLFCIVNSLMEVTYENG
jgi:hypothetical protein